MVETYELMYRALMALLDLSIFRAVNKGTMGQIVVEGEKIRIFIPEN